MKKLLVVVDMQNDFISGVLGTDEAKKIVPDIAKYIKEFRESGHDVIFTMDSHHDNYDETLEGKNNPIKHCIVGTDGWSIVSELEEEGVDPTVFMKETFGCTTLGYYVADNEYDEIQVCGVCTDTCVISNALLMKAFAKNTPIKVIVNLCAGTTPEKHEIALAAMKQCQIELWKIYDKENIVEK